MLVADVAGVVVAGVVVAADVVVAGVVVAGVVAHSSWWRCRGFLFWCVTCMIGGEVFAEHTAC